MVEEVKLDIQAARERCEAACVNCGAPFTPRRKDHRFCCARCRWTYKERTTGREARNRRTAAYRKTEKGKAVASAITRRQYQKNPEAAMARAMSGHALRRGEIVQASECESCDAPGRLEAHHHNGYKRDHWLDVRWLCKPCHVEVHHVLQN